MPFIKAPNWALESYPFCFYQKLGISLDTMQIVFNLEKGYHFVLERIHARYAAQNVNLPGLYANPLQIYFRKDAMAKTLSNFPFDVPLFVTPGESGIAVDVLNPAFPHSAGQMTKAKAFHTMYFFQDIIFLEISGITVNGGTPALSLPPFLEIMLKGRYFPGKEGDQA